MKKSIIILGIVFLLLAVFLLRYSQKMFFDYDGDSWDKSGAPCICFTLYFRNPETGKSEEGSMGIAFDNPQLKDQEAIEESKKRGWGPFIHVIGSGEDASSINAVRLKTDEDGTEHFRINVATRGVVYVFDDAEYHGEDYRLIGFGEDWYLSFSRPRKVKE